VLLVVLPGADPPKILGYMAGASFGYVLEKEKIKTMVNAPLVAQIIKVIIGLAVLFGIIVGLGGLLPSAIKPLGFIRYALGGIWVTLLAPLLFSVVGLAGREKN
jgi:Zn-dependent protease